MIRFSRYELRVLCVNQKTFQADCVMSDASRCAKKECVLVHLASCGLLCAPPLQVLPDQAKVQEPQAAMERVTKVLTSARPSRTPKEDKPELEPTKLLGVAITQAVLAVMPFKTFAVYAPSSVPMPQPGVEKQWSLSQQQWYFWNPEEHSATWVLPYELRCFVNHKAVRILVLIGDEGSTGWAFFQFLANHVRLRVLFLRDPLHRLSNLFTNALRAELRCFDGASRLIVLAKFRNGPCGSGRFWTELKETLRLFLSRASLDHPVVQMFLPEIARDYGKHVGLLTWEEAKRLMFKMNADMGGQGVDTRRWWSIYDSTKHNLPLWGTMKLAMVVRVAMDGKNPWELLRRSVPVVKRGDKREEKNFAYKSQVLSRDQTKDLGRGWGWAGGALLNTWWRWAGVLVEDVREGGGLVVVLPRYCLLCLIARSIETRLALLRCSNGLGCTTPRTQTTRSILRIGRV